MLLHWSSQAKVFRLAGNEIVVLAGLTASAQEAADACEELGCFRFRDDGATTWKLLPPVLNDLS